MTTHIQAIVVGGGISGLVCGFALRQAGIETLVVEASANAGGVIQTERREGYLLELGPQSFSGTPQLVKLCRDLGIESQLVEAPARAPRFVLIDGRLRPVPLSPPALLLSSLLSVRTKLSLLRDALGRSVPPESDESLAAFTLRKFTPELLDRLVGPFVSGIYAGDPERLSLRGAFPQVQQAEREAGSVIRGMVRAAKGKPGAAASRTQSGIASSEPAPKRRPTLQSFRDGNAALVSALAAQLGSALQLNTRAIDIRFRSSGPTPNAKQNFTVTLNANGSSQQVTAEHLVLATPADVSAQLLSNAAAGLSSALQAIEYAPITVVSLGYVRAGIQHSLEGFGFLIPRSAKLRTLGTVWNSSLFPGRAPEGHVLLTSFVGGATDPAATALTEAELVSLVHREIGYILQIQSQPAFAHVTVYPRALPQYNLGHTERVALIEKHLSAIPSLHLADNYLHGPAVGACVERGLVTAEAIAKALTQRSAAEG